MPSVYDVFPFYNEDDQLEIRLNELAPLVEKFIIFECDETFGGEKRELHYPKIADRYKEFKDKIRYVPLSGLSDREICKDRESGRKREKIMRDMVYPVISALRDEDIIIFSDCDEIPCRASVEETIKSKQIDYQGIHRLKQHSYYYNVNTRVDYGHDFASRARVGEMYDLRRACDYSLYNFRMYLKGDASCPVIENGGWHYSYFGGIEKIKEKTAAMSNFLEEYKLFGDGQLELDIRKRRDLHHRRTEMPEVFEFVPTVRENLPEYLWSNGARFPHFFSKEAA
jgi:hypothetical protein